MADRYYDSQNPKSYYNYSDYTSGSGQGQTSSSNRTPKVPQALQKPDEATPESSSSTPIGPPPPYSPQHYQQDYYNNNRNSSDYPSYGTIPDQQQPLLLDRGRNASRSPPPPPQQPKQWTNPHIPRDWAQEDEQDNRRNNNNDHQALVSDISPAVVQAISPRRRPGDDDDDDDPGCCKRWCKYLFLAILIWLVVLKYGDSIRWPFGPDHHGGGGGFVSCNGMSAVLWDELPDNIDVEKNVFVTVDGQFSGGQITVHRRQDNSKGSIQAKVYASPSSVFDLLSYELHEGDDTQLTLHMPTTASSSTSSSCLSIDMTIWLPGKAEVLSIHTRNMKIEIMDTLEKMESTDLQTSNAPIIMHSIWRGEKLLLQTSNANIRVQDSIHADESIRIGTTNGAITLTDDAIAKRTIELINTNGDIRASNSVLKADHKIQIKTSNAATDIDTVDSATISINSANGLISVDHAKATMSLDSSTSNAPIDLQLESAKDSRAQLKTSNANVSLNVATAFEGYFKVQTSSYNKAVVEDTQGPLDLDVNKPNHKQGRRQKGKGSLIVNTSNGDATVKFNV